VPQRQRTLLACVIEHSARDLPEDLDEVSGTGLVSMFKGEPPLDYNLAFPIETFDIIVADEAHRSIYTLWRKVLEYFASTAFAPR
jgi:type I restriction enzyme R subunit